MAVIRVFQSHEYPVVFCALLGHTWVILRERTRIRLESVREIRIPQQMGYYNYKTADNKDARACVQRRAIGNSSKTQWDTVGTGTKERPSVARVRCLKVVCAVCTAVEVGNVLLSKKKWENVQHFQNLTE